MNTIKVLHKETHWQCGDGCCDNYDVVSSYMYNDKIYEFDEGSIDLNIAAFFKEVFGVEFEEEYEYEYLR